MEYAQLAGKKGLTAKLVVAITRLSGIEMKKAKKNGRATLPIALASFS